MWLMTTNLTEALQTQIEQLVHQYLAAQQKATLAAVERAFATTAPVRVRPVRAPPGRRRRTSEVAQLAERLCDAVRACPGETMAVLAARVGEKPGALNRPMHHLKRAGRVSSAGERQLTRYFPMGAVRSVAS
jgi:CRP-like cAMP-binding protein